MHKYDECSKSSKQQNEEFRSSLFTLDFWTAQKNVDKVANVCVFNVCSHNIMPSNSNKLSVIRSMKLERDFFKTSNVCTLTLFQSWLPDSQNEFTAFFLSTLKVCYIYVIYSESFRNLCLSTKLTDFRIRLFFNIEAFSLMQTNIVWKMVKNAKKRKKMFEKLYEKNCKKSHEKMI